MSDAPNAVFISYAREDTDAARRIAEALRSHGVEVWFDQNELRGGDAWDAKIRKQINDCTLFLPVISQHTQERGKGYFRLEWKLAVEQTHLMAEGMAFLAPVVVDHTSESGALVPPEFLRVQWTRLPGALPTPQFVEQIRRLLDHPHNPAGNTRPTAATPAGTAPRPAGLSRWLAVAGGTVLLLGIAYLALRPSPKEPASLAKITAPGPVANAVVAPADSRSVAVLAFANLSDDKENEYFSDGISEELLTVLQKIPGLQVAARTSAFSFKGKNATAQEIGEKLGVANLVEGSVRRSGNTVRISARLSRAATGQQLWSDSFTRDLKDVFAVQSEIAQTIVAQLRGQLGGATDADAKAAIQAQVQAAEKGGTKNVEAHQLYLQGKFFGNQLARENLAQAATYLRRAVELDPSFALAWAALSRVLSYQGAYGTLERPLADVFRDSRAMAERALALEPNLAEAHAALFQVQSAYDLDWRNAAATARRALELAPSDATNLVNAAVMAATFGQTDRAIALIRQALALDPLNTNARLYLADAYGSAGRFQEAEQESRRLLEINPAAIGGNWGLCSALLLEGRIDEAADAAARETEEWARLTALAIVRWAQKKPADSEAALQQLIKRHDYEAAYQVAEIYAYRGEVDRAFAWLERAYRQHDSGLGNTKTDLLLKNLQADPRWPAFLRKVGLADDQIQ